MKRRTFLTSLFAIPAGLVAAAKALAKPREWRCIISPDVKVIDMRSARWVPSLNETQRHLIFESNPRLWLHTTRTTHIRTNEYDDVIAALFEKDPVKREIEWHERRKTNSRHRLAELRAEPTPKLPA